MEHLYTNSIHTRCIAVGPCTRVFQNTKLPEIVGMLIHSLGHPDRHIDITTSKNSKRVRVIFQSDIMIMMIPIWGVP